MIKELSELGKTLRSQKTGNDWAHDALKEEIISLVLTIKPDGSFVSLQSIGKKKTMAEALQRTSGKSPRLLLDNCGYVLGVYDDEGTSFKKKTKEIGESLAHEYFKRNVAEKHLLFFEKLKNVDDLVELKPVLNFYTDQRHLGIDIVNQSYFLNNIPKKERSGNVAILVSGTDKYVHENELVYRRLIDTYNSAQYQIISNAKRKCSICAKETFPVGDYTHYPIKGVPGDKEPAGGRKLISYNGDNNPFESYEMIGNENSNICTNCANTYVEALNSLLSKGTKISNKNNKEDIFYSNRWPRKRSEGYYFDTAIVFWTRMNSQLSEMDQLEMPTDGEVAKLIDSVTSGKESDSQNLSPDQFYSCTLSGSAARIAVRDWIETSLIDFRKSIARWFMDIAIEEYDFDLKQIRTHYSRLYDLARSCQRKNNSGVYDKDDTSLARVASALWNAALKNTAPPLWILTKVLQRARLDEYGITADRAALIKLILNRNNKGGNFVITEKIIQGNRPVAYICGQIFAKLESIQYAALGDRNAGIRERYFTYAMTMPASAFGRLFNLNSKHFTKLKNEKPGLAINLDKELQELCKDIVISNFPATFSFEEQGQFAIGYYHQKQTQFNTSKAKENKEEK